MRGMARRGVRARHTATMAKPPLRAMSMPQGRLKWALVPTPSRKPRAPLPATVETSRVARSMRRMLWLPCSCDASGGGDAYSAEEPPEERQQMARSVMAVAPSHVRGDVCSLACALSAGWRGAWSPRGTWRHKPGTHRDHGERAARVDRHAGRRGELGVRSDAVAGASCAARERAGPPRGKNDMADAVVAIVLRCMGAGNTYRRSGRAVWCSAVGTCVAPMLSVCQNGCTVCGMA